MSSLLDRMTRAEIAQQMTPREIAARARDAVGSYWPGSAGDELEQLRGRIRALEAERRELRNELGTERAARLKAEVDAGLLRHALMLLAPREPDAR